MTEKDLEELRSDRRMDALAHDEREATADSITANPMQWVKHLPEVGDPLLRKRTDIGRLVDRAADLEIMAKQLRQQAYSLGLSLEGDCRRLWSAEDISAAKKRAELPQ